LSLHGPVEMREPFFYFSLGLVPFAVQPKFLDSVFVIPFVSLQKKYFVLFLFLALHKCVLPIGEEVAVASLFPKRNFVFILSLLINVVFYFI
jgi:hypothetical protein